ncbi:hypothetical protein I7819_17690 [Burkholderia multivorans]|uniref:hypothetical protein n=1 Tax=Burkholderia multivorans TaxID=87883 RepID=UPI001906AAD5|nr:hypothetical protein [Burkholderia multivorans]MBJ9941710.1 hypothetical protein [Burkholderia multivorans]MBU9286879.1 hypothetical protein [Burkholderia multivorans]
MVNKILLFKFLICVAAIRPMSGWCAESILQQLSGEQLEKGCNLDFYAVNLANDSPAIGRPDYSIDMRWACDGKPTKIVDTYEVEGGSPQIVTVFYRNRKDVVVLVKWSTNSQASDIQGDYYKIYVYRIALRNLEKPFLRQEGVMKKLGEGWDGEMNGNPVHYPLKDAASIRKALNRLGY